MKDERTEIDPLDVLDVIQNKPFAPEIGFVDGGLLFADVVCPNRREHTP